jgi:hypothetical protein
MHHDTECYHMDRPLFEFVWRRIVRQLLSKDAI